MLGRFARSVAGWATKMRDNEFSFCHRPAYYSVSFSFAQTKKDTGAIAAPTRGSGAMPTPSNVNYGAVDQD